MAHDATFERLHPTTDIRLSLVDEHQTVIASFDMDRIAATRMREALHRALAVGR